MKTIRIRWISSLTVSAHERLSHDRFGDFSPTLKRQAVYIGRRYATCKCHSTYKWRSHDRFMSNWVSTRCDRMRCNKVSTPFEKKCDFTLTGQLRISSYVLHSPFPCGERGQGIEVLLNLPFNANLTIKNQLLRSAFPFPLWGKGLGDRGLIPA